MLQQESERGTNVRSGNLSDKQKKKLILFLQDAEDLRKGKFSSTFTFKDAQQQWTRIADNLNSIPGARKDWKAWRRCWQDIKKTTKRKSSDLKKYCRGTGGGPSSEITFTEDDENVLGMLETTAVEGDPDIQESVVFMEYGDEEDSDNLGSADVGTAEDAPSNNHKKNIKVCPKTEMGRFATVQLRKHRSSTKRLDSSIQASEKLWNQCEKKIAVKSSYYQQKLELMTRDVIAKERIAAALELLAENMPSTSM